MHKPQIELKNEIEQAKKLVTVGGIYSHYKNPDNKYKVIDIAVNEADEVITVIYQALYGENIIFLRAVESWLGQVEVDGKMINRLTLDK